MWVCNDLGWIGQGMPTFLPYIIAVITAGCGILMISNLRYPSFKGINFTARVPLAVIAAIIVFFAIVGMDPPKVLLFLISLYVLSGFVVSLKKV